MSLAGVILRGFHYAAEGGNRMGYRKVGYLEQCWYIIRYWLQERFRRR